ncbi:MAG: hypothetical protein ACHQRM_12295 [Bacteroidia bacterium]
MNTSGYNNPFLISKIIRIIQDRHPEASVGNYVKHKLAPDGRGFRVRVDNGSILVTYDALANVYDADEVPAYTEVMIQSFEPDTNRKSYAADRSSSRISKLIQFFAGKKPELK